MVNNVVEKEAASPQARAMRVRFVRETVLKLSRADMEKLMPEIKEASLENWEYARYSGLTERGAMRLEEACQRIGINCTAKWLLFGIGRAPGDSYLPQLFSPAEKLTDPHSTQEENIAAELRLFYQLNKGVIDFIVTDDSLSPSYRQGDYLAGVQYFGEEIESAIDKDCIVKTMLGHLLVRIVKKGTLPQHYSLVKLYPDKAATQADRAAMDNVKIISAAPILWIRRKS